jgi:hypothetical protein
MSYKQFPDKASAVDAAEAVGRLWAASIGKSYTPTGVAPDVYGPGRQPVPPEAYYQRYWQAPQDAVTADPPNGIPRSLPIRIEADSFVVAQDGKVVRIAGNRDITLDFRGLQT